MSSDFLAASEGLSGTDAGGPAEAVPLALEVRNASKTYGAARALREVSFELRRGEAHALLGHNGAGKSTLVKVIAGQIHPDEGEVLVAGEPVMLSNPRRAQEKGIAVVDQELSLAPDLTVAENVDMGRVGSSFFGRSHDRQHRIAGILQKLGLPHVRPHTLVSSLTIAERQLVEIARALSRDAKVLLLDEPTATLSDGEIARVFAVVRGLLAEGRSVILVTHRLGEVIELCDRVTVLRDGRRRATRDVAGLDRDGIIRLMLDDENVETAVSRTTELEDRSTELEVDRLTVGRSCRDVSLAVRRGEILGIAGQIGSGGSTVLRALAGLHPEATGRVSVDGRPVSVFGSPSRAAAVGMGFVSNDRKSEGLFLTKSVGRNLTATRPSAVSSQGVVRPSRARKIARDLTTLIGMDRRRLSQAVAELSGGNQQKVFIGRSLRHPRVRVLLLDEPTRGVDVAGRSEIHNLIRQAADTGAAVVFVSSELDEILDLSDTVLTMFAGRVVRRHARANLTAETVLGETTHRTAADKEAMSA